MVVVPKRALAHGLRYGSQMSKTSSHLPHKQPLNHKKRHFAASRGYVGVLWTIESRILYLISIESPSSLYALLHKTQEATKSRRVIDHLCCSLLFIMAYNDDAVLAKLSSINETHDSIVTVSQWIMFHRFACHTILHGVLVC